MHQLQFFDQVRRDQGAILRRWLRLHRRAAGLLVVAAALVEAAVGVVSVRSSSFDAESLSDYFLYYLLVPSGLNLGAVAVVEVLTRREGVPFSVQKYAVSLGMLAVSLVLYTIHSIFFATSALLLVAVLLTAIYGDYRLTSVTAALGVTGLLYGGLFAVWDPAKVPVQSNARTLVNFLLEVLIQVGGYLLCLVIIYYERQKNDAILRAEEEQYHLEQALRTDSLTRLYNRTALREAFDRLELEGNTAVLAMLDLDRFKQLNDTYGHPRGDQCLTRFAGILREAVGEYPIFRYGGDEFCVLFWGADREEAARRCREICAALEGSELHRRYQIGASIGLAEYAPGMTAHQLLVRADRALYQAKAAGGGVYVGGEAGAAARP